MELLHNILVSSPVNGDGLLPRVLIVLLYLGPETIMPLASILAAILGFLLIFWRMIVNFIKKLFKRSKPESLEATAEDSEAEAYVDPLDK